MPGGIFIGHIAFVGPRVVDPANPGAMIPVVSITEGFLGDGDEIWILSPPPDHQLPDATNFAYTVDGMTNISGASMEIAQVGSKVNVGLNENQVKLNDHVYVTKKANPQ